MILIIRVGPLVGLILFSRGFLFLQCEITKFWLANFVLSDLYPLYIGFGRGIYGRGYLGVVKPSHAVY